MINWINWGKGWLFRWRARQTHAREQEIELIRKEMGFVQSRALNQHDTVECCQWVLDNCRHSLRTKLGKGTKIIVRNTMDQAQARIDKALAEGLRREDDWVVQRLPPFLLECERERMLFKLTWF